MNFGRFISCSFSMLSAETVLGVLLAGMPGPSYAQMRWEMRPIETVTLSDQQFLTGDENGKLATLAGELRIPKPGTDKLPVVILLHGSAGIGSNHDQWAQELNAIGVATFLLDSFSGRGITGTVNEQSQLDGMAMHSAVCHITKELTQTVSL